MRGAKCVESEISEPPKPRLKTGWPGKSCTNVLQRLIIEEPVNSTPPFGGGFVASDCSKAAISPSHWAKLWFVSAPSDDRVGKTRIETASAKNAIGFMHLRLETTLLHENEFRGQLSVPDRLFGKGQLFLFAQSGGLIARREIGTDNQNGGDGLRDQGLHRRED